MKMKHILLFDYQLNNTVRTGGCSESAQIIRLNRRLKNLLRGYYNVGIKKGNIPFSQALLILGKMLKKREYDVKYFNLNIIDYRNIIDVKKADMIFLSVMTSHVGRLAETLKHIKSINPDVKICVGGYHVQFQGKSLMESIPEIDICALTEVEVFVKQMDGHGDHFENYEGVLLRHKEEIIENKSSNYVVPENEMETPDYDLLHGDYDQYAYNLSTMRGCIGRCSFCVNGYCWGSPRYLSMEKIIAQLDWYAKNLSSYTIIHFTDNIFTLDRKRFMEICNYIEEKNICFRYSCDVNAKFVDKELVIRLKKAGFFQIALGFEDASDDVLKFNHKMSTYEDNIKAVSLIREYSDMMILAYWMTGLPGTTKESMLLNIKEINYLLENKIVDIVSAKMFVPYPGTPVFENPEKYGIEVFDFNWSNYDRSNGRPVYRLNEIDEYELWSYFIYLISTINRAYSKQINMINRRRIKNTGITMYI